jgi:hypothetical protein
MTAWNVGLCILLGIVFAAFVIIENRHNSEFNRRIDGTDAGE